MAERFAPLRNIRPFKRRPCPRSHQQSLATIASLSRYIHKASHYICLCRVAASMILTIALILVFTSRGASTNLSYWRLCFHNLP